MCQHRGRGVSGCRCCCPGNQAVKLCSGDLQQQCWQKMVAVADDGKERERRGGVSGDGLMYRAEAWRRCCNAGGATRDSANAVLKQYTHCSNPHTCAAPPPPPAVVASCSVTSCAHDTAAAAHTRPSKPLLLLLLLVAICCRCAAVSDNNCCCCCCWLPLSARTAAAAAAGAAAAIATACAMTTAPPLPLLLLLLTSCASLSNTCLANTDVAAAAAPPPPVPPDSRLLSAVSTQQQPLSTATAMSGFCKASLSPLNPAPKSCSTTRSWQAGGSWDTTAAATD